MIKCVWCHTKVIPSSSQDFQLTDLCTVCINMQHNFQFKEGGTTISGFRWKTGNDQQLQMTPSFNPLGALKTVKRIFTKNKKLANMNKRIFI